MDKRDEIVSNLTLELRRGTLILSVLSQLSIPQYGYSLIQCLNENGVQIDIGTIYPLLRRLEKQGLLESVWEVGEGRPRRYYKLSEGGKEVYDILCEEWFRMSKGVERLINGGENQNGAD
ncbi:PadR family transcriptional regulator [Clostridium sp. AM58-1XD]|uniref:PadR family transcriptional regulator n=1 Tax=Clostridium sp. AM58-1XD TaxID=2292307 RepID=UPI000E5080F0|nr:PadR family transcriptional regulator [Clostridium sp. AM58-1XD]RGZ01605.1 PadR family transcriptional regulator [Clostridium sp. AM58-1XD]